MAQRGGPPLRAADLGRRQQRRRHAPGRTPLRPTLPGARAAGDPPFGSLLAGPDGAVLAEERNTTVTGADISAHPELKLAVWAARELDAATAAATTMYTSCQPCRMCAGAIERSGPGRVVFALSNDQLAGLKPGGGWPDVPQEGPALYAEARVPLNGYYG